MVFFYVVFQRETVDAETGGVGRVEPVALHPVFAVGQVQQMLHGVAVRVGFLGRRTKMLCHNNFLYITIYVKGGF